MGHSSRSRGLATPDKDLHSASSNASVVQVSNHNFRAREQPIRGSRHNDALISQPAERPGTGKHSEQIETFGSDMKGPSQQGIRHEPTGQTPKSNAITKEDTLDDICLLIGKEILPVVDLRDVLGEIVRQLRESSENYLKNLKSLKLKTQGVKEALLSHDTQAQQQITQLCTSEMTTPLKSHDIANFHQHMKKYDTTTTDLQLTWKLRTGILATKMEKGLKLVSAPEFMKWISSRKSRQLAILDDTKCTQLSHVMSLFCMLMYQATTLTKHEYYLPLIFFCGTHSEHSSSDIAAMMVKSLIAQLLRDDLEIKPNNDLKFDTHGLDPNVTQKIGENDVMAMCSLFEHLLYQLPQDMTVLIMIDGIHHCTEKNQDTELFFNVILLLARMASNQTAGEPRIKIMVTSQKSSPIMAYLVGPKSRGLRAPLVTMSLFDEDITKAQQGISSYS